MQIEVCLNSRALIPFAGSLDLYERVDTRTFSHQTANWSPTGKIKYTPVHDSVTLILMPGCCPAFLAAMVREITVPVAKVCEMEHAITKPNRRWCLLERRANCSYRMDISEGKRSTSRTKCKSLSSDGANTQRDSQMGRHETSAVSDKWWPKVVLYLL